MDKRKFLQTLISASMALPAMKLSTLDKITSNFPASPKMPVLFIGHGHPMNALFDNGFTRRLARLQEELPRPNAILMLSAHWLSRGTRVSTNPWPETIYDFGGFDERLFRIKYGAKGHPELARSIPSLVKNGLVAEDEEMGLDHGAWTVLKHLYPEANIPVFQISLAYNHGPRYHFELGQQIKSLREKGVLVIGSGNIVHNLYQLDWHNIDAAPFEWNLAFDAEVKKAIDSRQFQSLIHYENFGKIAALSVPTNDHYLPMLFALGLADRQEPIEHIYEGYQFAGISMRCFRIG